MSGMCPVLRPIVHLLLSRRGADEPINFMTAIPISRRNREIVKVQFVLLMPLIRAVRRQGVHSIGRTYDRVTLSRCAGRVACRVLEIKTDGQRNNHQS